MKVNGTPCALGRASSRGVVRAAPHPKAVGGRRSGCSARLTPRVRRSSADYLGAMSRDEDALEHTNTFGIIDTRSAWGYSFRHAARPRPLPWGSDGNELWERVHELPPRGIPIAVVSDKLDELNAVANFLAVNRIMPIVFRMLLTEDVVSALQHYD